MRIAGISQLRLARFCAGDRLGALAPRLADTLIGAAKAGELDGLMAASGKPVGAPKARKAA